MIGKIFIPIIQLNDIEYDENFKYEGTKNIVQKCIMIASTNTHYHYMTE